MPLDLNNGYSAVTAEKRGKRSSSSNQRMSPYFFLTTSSHSSQGSSNSPPLPAHNIYRAQNYFYAAPEYMAPMWHMNKYKEDELPNVSSNLAAALYHPRLQMGQNPQAQIPNRRFSVASVSSNGNNINYVQPQDKRRISVSKYQNIPAANFLQIPEFHRVDVPSCDYDDPTDDYNSSPAQNKSRIQHNSHRKFSSSGGCIPKTTRSRQIKSLSRDSSRSRSHSPVDNKGTHSRARASSLERTTTPDPSNLPVPAFEFTSSHLPLRPPTEDIINKYSSGSGSTSTPESQRLESRQMIRSSSSRIPYSTKGDPHIETKKDGAGSKRGGRATSTGRGDGKSIFSSTRPAKFCNHGENETCKNCTMKSDAQSQCSSVNPPPTFTKLDNYQPVRPRKSRCSCTCGAVFGITVILAVLVMLFIAAFILYVEMVLKYQTANVTDKM